MRFAFIARHCSIWPVACLATRGMSLVPGCLSFRVQCLADPLAEPALPGRRGGWRQCLCELQGDRTYGARRVWSDLLADGVSCGLHRIERLMRSQALRARPRRRGLPKDEGARITSVIAPNVLDREFTATRPNQRWIAGLPYVWTAEGWLYMAAVIDLFSRRVVGWSMKAEMTAGLVTDALIMAIWRRGKPDALLHHSDQGSQYTSQHFQELLAENGVTCSMSRSGNVWDNAAMENFFLSLKTERIRGEVYRTRDAARVDVFDYIERFYNTIRRHSTIGYLSPAEFEKVGLA